MNYAKLRKNIISSGSVDGLTKLKSEFELYAYKSLQKDLPKDEIIDFLYLCLDYYTFSESGDVLIPDSVYDAIVRKYLDTPIVHPDVVGKHWEFIKHEVPGVVGSLGKIYSYQELKNYIRSHHSDYYILAPKYDGISVSIHIQDGRMFSAATRYDGIEGQNISEVVRRAVNYHPFMKIVKDGFYKCELVVSSDDFEKLGGRYKNRRSATSAIINTPTNLEYASAITIIPLLYYNQKEEKIDYVAPRQQTVRFLSPQDLLDTITQMLDQIRRPEFGYRVDGVVIYPVRALENDQPNELDLMDKAIAYKINTQEAKTTIEYGYMSVGRLGNAVPKLKVRPVEVNEIVVSEVSLGSYDKFKSMGLKVDDEIIVYAAGDVIPQVKFPEFRTSSYASDDLKIKKICPYCNTKLTRFGTEYACTNQDCPRVITGRIANFLVKCGIDGFSDKTVESIYASLGVRSIPEFLQLTYDDLLRVDGFDKKSSENLSREIQRLRNTPITSSKLFGALGADNISEKKFRKIFEYITVDELLEKNSDRAYYDMQCADGIGSRTAKILLEFIREHRKEIKKILSMMHVTVNISYDGNLVFTGFRPGNAVIEKMNSLGLEEGASVTSNTVAVFAASTDKSSSKTRAAAKKGIPIYSAYQLDDFLNSYHR